MNYIGKFNYIYSYILHKHILICKYCYSYNIYQVFIMYILYILTIYILILFFYLL